MIDVVVIISIHSVYNCKYVQSSGHPISCATNPPPSRRQPENFSQRLPPYEQCVIFVSLSLSPSQLSRLFFVFFPSFVDTHTRAQTDRQTQLYDIYDIPVNVKVQVLDSICASHSILFIYCVPVYCHLFYVYSLSFYLSLFLVYSKKRSWITPAVQIFQ